MPLAPVRATIWMARRLEDVARREMEEERAGQDVGSRQDQAAVSASWASDDAVRARALGMESNPRLKLPPEPDLEDSNGQE